MTLIPSTQVRDVRGISTAEKLRIMDFLQGAVYCWCKNRKNEWFSMRDLMGGDNYNWAGTPLLPLYTSQINAGAPQEAAVAQAGRDSGWLLKKVIADDARPFETKTEDLTRKYRWLQPDAEESI